MSDLLFLLDSLAARRYQDYWIYLLVDPSHIFLSPVLVLAGGLSSSIRSLLVTSIQVFADKTRWDKNRLTKLGIYFSEYRNQLPMQRPNANVARL